MYKEFRGEITVGDVDDISFNLLGDTQPIQYIEFCDIPDEEVGDDNVQKYVKSFLVYLENSLYYLEYNYHDGTHSSYSGSFSVISSQLQGSFPDGFQYIGTIRVNATSTTLIGYLKTFVDFDVSYIYLYRLKSPKNKLDKELEWVTTIPLKFNRPITYKRITADLKIDTRVYQFNYVFITSLNRFYFVNDIVLTNEFAQCDLIEDVLSTWRDEIRLQKAYVERNENDYDVDKVDDLVIYDYDKVCSFSQVGTIVTLFSSTDSDELTRRSCVITTVSSQ